MTSGSHSFDLEPFTGGNFDVDEETSLLWKKSQIQSSTGDNTDDQHNSHIFDTFSNSLLTGIDHETLKETNNDETGVGTALLTFFQAIPAVILVTILNLMLAVSFGSSYFTSTIPLDDEDRAKLGIRLSLLALSVGQFVMGGGIGSFCSSGFHILTVWQLGELTPFYHRFADIAAAVSPDPSCILPTTLYLCSLSSITFAIFCFLLGKFKLGQLTYFFPTYVMLGLIGGIGLWFFNLSFTISISPSLTSSSPNFYSSIMDPHFLICIPGMILLQILRRIIPKEKLTLLDPIFFLSVPLLFYIILYISGIPLNKAIDEGYFFAPPTITTTVETVTKSDDIQQQLSNAFSDAAKLWIDFSFSKVQYNAILPALSTLLCSGLLGVLMTSPFIPATATLQNSDQETDFNREFLSHGWSNIISAISVPGGLAVAVCYTTSSVFKNTGGKGKLARLFLGLLLFLCMIYGPVFVNLIPRCMASLLILDLGIHLCHEAIVEPWFKLDSFEYTSVWVIMVVVNVASLTDGLIAGLFAALFTFMLQSLTVKNPIRLACDASLVPSSKWRTATQRKVLDGPLGRKQIAIFQLQGSLFFGNLSELSDKIFNFLLEKQKKGGCSIVILDFSLVIGVDNTAAKFIEEMNERIEKKFDVKKTIMISGHLDTKNRRQNVAQHHRSLVISQIPPSEAFNNRKENLVDSRRHTSFVMRGPFDPLMEEADINGTFYNTLGDALMKCEDEIIAHVNPSSKINVPNVDLKATLGEIDTLVTYLCEKLDSTKNQYEVQTLLKHCTREVHLAGTVLWRLGDKPKNLKILIRGSVEALILKTDAQLKSKIIERGEIIGLRSMILNQTHQATITCVDTCITYSLDRMVYENLLDEHPQATRLLDVYLSKSLQCHLQYVSGLAGIQDFNED